MSVETIQGVEVARINPQPATRLLLEDRLVHDDVLNSQLGLYRVETDVKDKVIMNHLKQPQDVLAPKANNRTWNPTLRIEGEPREFGVEAYTMMGEMYADEFDLGVARLMQQSGPEMIQVAGEGFDPFTRAAAILASEGVVNSLQKLCWFSDPGFNSGSDVWGAPDLSGLDADHQARLSAMLTKQTCGWAEIVKFVQQKEIVSINTNDGTLEGNGALPANVTTMFDNAIKKAHPILKHFRYNQARTGEGQPVRGVFLVSGGIFDAYAEYLRDRNQDQAFDFTINGQRIPYMLLYKNYAIIHMTGWDDYDLQTGRWNYTLNQSLKQRLIFTIPQVLTIGADVIGTGRGGRGPGMIIQRSTHVRDLGVLWMYYALRAGMSFTQPHMLVAGWNGSDSYVTA